MPHEIDRLCQLLEFAGEPVAIGVNGAVKAGRDCGAKSVWRQTNNVIVVQMRNEIVPDRLRFWISVNKNNGHLSFSPKKICRTIAHSKAPPPARKHLACSAT